MPPIRGRSNKRYRTYRPYPATAPILRDIRLNSQYAMIRRPVSIRAKILSTLETKRNYATIGGSSGAGAPVSVPAGQTSRSDLTALIAHDNTMMSRTGQKVRLLSTQAKYILNNEAAISTGSLTGLFFARLVCIKLPGAYTIPATIPDFYSYLFSDNKGISFAHDNATPNLQRIMYPLNTSRFSVLYDEVFRLSEGNNNPSGASLVTEGHSRYIKTPRIPLNFDVQYMYETSATTSAQPTIFWILLVEEENNSTTTGALRVMGQQSIWYKDI